MAATRAGKEDPGREPERRGEGRRVEESAFEVDGDGRVRHGDTAGHASHVPVDLDDGDAEELGGLRFADDAFGQGPQAEPAKAVRPLPRHGAVLLVGGRAPPEPAELAEQGAAGGGGDDAEVPAAARQRLRADAEDALQGEEFADGDGGAALADLGPQRLGGHQERAGEAARGPFRVELGCNGEHDVAKLMRDGESLTLAPVPGVHDDEGNGGCPGRPARAARSPTPLARVPIAAQARRSPAWLSARSP